MKRQIFTLLSILCLGLVVQAQPFNKTYFPAPDQGGDNKGNKVAILPWFNPNSTADDKIVFTVNNKDKYGALINLDLVVTDAAGIFVIASKIAYPLEHHHIATTRDGGIIFAGYTDLANNYLYIIKFDMFGAQQWQRRVRIRQKNIYGPYENVDIEPIYDNASGLENYFISFSEGNSIPGQENVPTQGVVKIDQNGNFFWHYCYERTAFRNEARAMTSFKPNGIDQRMISLASTGKPNGSFTRPCFMTIDQNGLIVTQMRGWWPLSDDERMPDIIWDSLGQHFVTVFTSNTGGISYPVYSSLAILKLDVTYDKAISGGLYHWLNTTNAMWGERNEGVSITKNNLGDHYIITGWAKILEGLIALHPQLEAPFIFKISRTDPMTTDILDVFNLRTLYDQSIGHNLKYSNQFHVTDKDNQTYLVPSKHWLTGGFHRPRLIKTDVNFSNCHSYNVDLKYRPPYWNYSIYDHVGHQIMEAEEAHLQIIPTSYSAQDCTTNPSYKPLSIDPATINTLISVYPTIIKDGDRDVVCEFKEDVAGELVDITVTNMLGQQTYKVQVMSYANFAEKVPSAAFTKGMNMLNISVDNKIMYSTKVVKL